MVICPNCKKELPDGLLFCTNCGASLPQTTPPPANMNAAALNSSSIIAPATPPQPAKKPVKNNKLPLIIGAIVGVVIVVVTVIIVAIVAGGNKNQNTATYTIPTASEVTPSSTTTAWLGNYFFSIPDTYNFELGMDEPYEALYLQPAGSLSTTTEIAYVDDVAFETLSAGSTINDFSKTLANTLEATDTKVSATTVSGINFYYMDFSTADGNILMAFSPADDSSFMTTVTGGGDTAVEQRLKDAATILGTAKRMTAADKGVPDDAGDIVDSGALIEELRNL